MRAARKPVDWNEVYANLSPQQKSAMDKAREVRDEEPEVIRETRRRSYAAVRKALEVGVPPQLVAHRLGVTTARVYQLSNAFDQN